MPIWSTQPLIEIILVSVFLTDYFYLTTYVNVDHCIEMLRINLMCIADITPITSNWVSWGNNPYPDFSTLHTCRNFDKIIDYVSSHAEG
jgi:hypothetical protein